MEFLRAFLTVGVTDNAVDWRLGPVGTTEGHLCVRQARGDQSSPGRWLRLNFHVVVGTKSAVSLGVSGAVAEDSLVQASEVLDIWLHLADLGVFWAPILELVDDCYNWK